MSGNRTLIKCTLDAELDPRRLALHFCHFRRERRMSAESVSIDFAHNSAELGTACRRGRASARCCRLINGVLFCIIMLENGCACGGRCCAASFGMFARRLLVAGHSVHAEHGKCIWTADGGGGQRSDSQRCVSGPRLHRAAEC